MTLLLLAVGIGSVSASTTIGTISYDLDAAKQTATVVGGVTTNGTINIPETVTYNEIEYAVTAIGWQAFYNNTNLTSIIIPNGIVKIGDGAFNGCKNLVSLAIGNNVIDIGLSAFSGCTSLTSLTIPNRVTRIGSHAFSGCRGLTSVTIPNSVSYIADNAFDECTSLPVIDNIRYADTYLVTVVDKTLNSYTIRQGTMWIAGKAFSDCKNIAAIVIPEGVKAIGGLAFQNCTALTSVNFPHSVTMLGSHIFTGCTSLNTPVYNNTCFAYMPSSFTGDYTIPDGMKLISGYAFSNCNGISSITIPKSLDSIGTYAFKGCTNITSVIWNAQKCAVTTQYHFSSESPFYDSQSKITSFILGEDVAVIPTFLCYGMTALTSISIPNNTKEIGYGAFELCHNLSTVNIGDSVEIIEESAFSGCKSLSSIELPESLTQIYSFAFSGCSSLTSIVIPKNVSLIGMNVFSGCSQLTSIVWNAQDCKLKCTSGADCAPFFNVESQITSFVIGDKVEVLPNYLCCSMSKLKSITIPANVRFIGYYAFAYTSFSEITWNARNCSYRNDYGPFNKDNLNNIKSFIFGNNVEVIPEYLCYNMKNITTVTIPNNVKDIKKYAFYNCDKLKTVQLSDSLFAIRDHTFCSCDSLLSITIPDNVDTIGNYAFDGCKSLESINIPYSVIGIGTNVFRDCSKLTTVKWNAKNCSNANAYKDAPFYSVAANITSFSLGDSVEFIPNFLCDGMANITSVTIPKFVTSIGNYAFRSCSKLASIEVKTETPPALGTTPFATYLKSIYVPCGTLNAYKASWSAYANKIKAPLSPYEIIINYDKNQGTVSYPSDACGEVIMTATPQYGYHFVQWNDGNIDNPRTIELTQDTTFTAEFAIDRSGKCGDNLALNWDYDVTQKTLIISGDGALNSNYTFGVEAPNNLEKLIIAEGVTSIGSSAFAKQTTLQEIILSTTVSTINGQAFYNCTGLKHIYNYRERPCVAYSNTFDGIDKFDCTLHVLSASVNMYKAATAWRDFYYIETIDAQEITITGNTVVVEPSDNAVVITWPVSATADTYTIEITKDSEVFCTLIFNGNGQLTGIAFAPSRNGSNHAPAAVMTANGLQFTVTGLNSGTQYGYNLTAKDANNQTVATYSGSFTTTREGETTGVDNVPSDQVQSTKFLRDGKMYIIRGEKIYNAQGALVK